MLIYILRFSALSLTALKSSFIKAIFNSSRTDSSTSFVAGFSNTSRSGLRINLLTLSAKIEQNLLASSAVQFFAVFFMYYVYYFCFVHSISKCFFLYDYMHNRLIVSFLLFFFLKQPRKIEFIQLHLRNHFNPSHGRLRLKIN